MVIFFFQIVVLPVCGGGFNWQQILAQVTKGVILLQKNSTH